MIVLFPSKKHKNSSVAMAMQRFFEFFRRKNYGALWNNLFNFFHYDKKPSRFREGFFRFGAKKDPNNRSCPRSINGRV